MTSNLRKWPTVQFRNVEIKKRAMLCKNTVLTMLELTLVKWRDCERGFAGRSLMNQHFNYSPIAPSFLFLPLFSFSHSLSPPFPYISHLFFPLFLLFFFFPLSQSSRIRRSNYSCALQRSNDSVITAERYENILRGGKWKWIITRRCAASPVCVLVCSICTFSSLSLFEGTAHDPQKQKK